MNTNPIDAAIQRAVDGAIKDEPRLCDTRMYVFVGRLIGSLEAVAPALAAKVHTLMGDAGAAEGLPQ